MKMDIKNFQNLCRQNRIKWSGHLAKRMLQRNISREDVINCIMSGEIIEKYPDYWINPTCLIFGYTMNNKVLHVVVGIDDYIHIVTAYYPDNIKFEDDLKTRRER